MILKFYTTGSGRNPILEYLDALPAAEQVDGYSVISALQKGETEKVFLKQWSGKIYEAYFYRHNRLFYIAFGSTTIYLLHACRKQKGKTEKRDRKIVEKRAKELEKQFKKGF